MVIGQQIQQLIGRTAIQTAQGHAVLKGAHAPPETVGGNTGPTDGQAHIIAAILVTDPDAGYALEQVFLAGSMPFAPLLPVQQGLGPGGAKEALKLVVCRGGEPGLRDRCPHIYLLQTTTPGVRLVRGIDRGEQNRSGQDQCRAKNACTTGTNIDTDHDSAPETGAQYSAKVPNRQCGVLSQPADVRSGH